MYVRRKLTDRLKEQIKRDYRSLRLRDFGGEALVYLKKVRGAAKGRKSRRDSVARIGKFLVPKDSDMYGIIREGAEDHHITVKQFIKKYYSEIEKLLERGDFVLLRESDKLIHDLASLKSPNKCYVNDFNGFVRTPTKEAILDIKLFVQYIISNSDAFLVLFRTHYKLNGDVYFYLPPFSDFDKLKGDPLIDYAEKNWLPWIKILVSKKKKRGKQRAKRIKR